VGAREYGTQRTVEFNDEFCQETCSLPPDIRMPAAAQGITRLIGAAGDGGTGTKIVKKSAAWWRLA
jgi:hypothetical protein